VNQIIEHIDKKEVILSVAEKLFSEQDFDAVSVRDLAKAANVNVAMISYYFGSKEKLFETLIVRRIEISQGSLKDIAGSNKPFLEKMYDMIDFYVDKLFSNTNFQKMMYRELTIDTRPHVRDLILSKIRENKELSKGMIEDEIKKGMPLDMEKLQMTIVTFFATIGQFNGSPYYSCQMLDFNNPADLHTREFMNRIRIYFKSIIKSQIPNNQ
jgi:AcrR family transcriptional regulator